MQPEITFGYQSSGNSPALQPGIWLSQIGSFVRTPQGNWTYSRSYSKTPPAEKRYSEWTSSQEACTPSTAPSLYLANVQSMDNKVDKLKAKISSQRDIGDCNILCFTETWLSLDILSPSIQPSGFSVHRTDSNKELSGKKKGGSVCFMNYSWCDCDKELKSFCSPNLKYLTIKCRPHYLPIEYSLVIVTAMYCIFPLNQIPQRSS